MGAKDTTRQITRSFPSRLHRIPPQRCARSFHIPRVQTLLTPSLVALKIRRLQKRMRPLEIPISVDNIALRHNHGPRYHRSEVKELRSASTSRFSKADMCTGHLCRRFNSSSLTNSAGKRWSIRPGTRNFHRRLYHPLLQPPRLSLKGLLLPTALQPRPASFRLLRKPTDNTPSLIRTRRMSETWRRTPRPSTRSRPFQRRWG